MTVLSNPIPKSTPFVPNSYIDTLYNYVAYLAPNNVPTPIGTMPKNMPLKQVAIVGAGMAGLVAAYELLKVGITPVIYEASNRIGGRADSRPFVDNGVPSTTDFAEMGSMRFPPSGQTFFYYVNQFGLPTTPQFPDPGKVPTTIMYENTAYQWVPGQNPPGPFAQLQSDWGAFITSVTSTLMTAWQNAQ